MVLHLASWEPCTLGSERAILIKYFAEMENVRKQGEAYLVLLLFASFLVLEFFLILEFEHGFMDQGFLVASGFAAYLLLVVISYILLSNPDVEPDWGTILLGLGLVVLITPGYVIIKTMREIQHNADNTIFLSNPTLAYLLPDDKRLYKTSKQ